MAACAERLRDGNILDIFPYRANKRLPGSPERNAASDVSNQTIALFEKTLGVYQATSVTDAQRRVLDLIETSLTTLRISVHSTLKTNTEIIASWKDLVDRFGPVVK